MSDPAARKRLKRKQEADVLNEIEDDINSMFSDDENSRDDANAFMEYTNTFKKNLENSTKMLESLTSENKAESEDDDFDSDSSDEGDDSSSSSDDEGEEDKEEKRPKKKPKKAKVVSELDALMEDENIEPSDDSDGLAEVDEINHDEEASSDGSDDGSDLKGFIVDGNEDEEEQKQQEEGGNDKSIDDEPDADQPDSLADSEYHISKDFKPSSIVLRIYEAYLKFHVLSFLIPKYRENLDTMLEQKELDEEQAKNINLQLKADIVISDMCDKVGSHVMEWIMERSKKTHSQDYFTMNKLKKILLCERKIDDKETYFDNNISFIEFTKSTDQLNVSTITKSAIPGTAWNVMFIDGNKEKQNEVMETKWKNFLNFWVFLSKQNDIIKDMAKLKFKDGDNLSDTEFFQFINKDLVATFSSIFVASMAFFEKWLRGTSYWNIFANISQDYYTVITKKK